MGSAPVVSAAAARTLLLRGQGLLQDPARKAGPTSLLRTIEQLGFVQVDSINVVARAHHQILHTRLDDYRPAHLKRLLERDRRLFEHWTHDASIIRADWFPWWRHRFALARKSPRFQRWVDRRLGADAERVLRHVWRRITREGPLMSRDFEDRRPDAGNGWWDWKPEKAALEMMWRDGRLSVAGRREFHKLYDRTDRVFPESSRGRRPSAAAHRDWACSAALDRLGVATPSELSRFFAALPIAEAKAWCERAARRGECIAVRVEAVDGSSQSAFAVPDWEERVRGAADPPDRLRLLSPFDPLIRDRERLARRFGFDYRIECFVPAPKRRYGYYVLPLMRGDRLVGRLDPKLDRERGVLRVRGLWWENGAGSSRTQRPALDEALGRFASWLGASDVEIQRTKASQPARGAAARARRSEKTG